MPIYEYKCEVGHVFERLYRTFRQAEAAPKEVCCDVCFVNVAEKIEFSVPFPAHLLGSPDGWSKPSPQKRHSTKLINRETGNRGTQRKR